jgi:hypothetical protein
MPSLSGGPLTAVRTAAVHSQSTCRQSEALNAWTWPLTTPQVAEAQPTPCAAGHWAAGACSRAATHAPRQVLPWGAGRRASTHGAVRPLVAMLLQVLRGRNLSHPSGFNKHWCKSWRRGTTRDQWRLTGTCRASVPPCPPPQPPGLAGSLLRAGPGQAGALRGSAGGGPRGGSGR